MSLFRCILAVLMFSHIGFAETTDPLRDVQRILFVGDSITQAGDYVTDIECWLLSRRTHIEVLNMGLGSETAAVLIEDENSGHSQKHGFPRPSVANRIGRILAAAKPDMVIAFYGMNDGGTLPANESGDKRFADAITSLRKAALDAGAKRVVICTPPVHDSGDSDNSGLHDGNLKRYSEWIKSNAGWDVVDIHGPMRAALDAARGEDPGFRFARDGVHPGREGHWLIAREILNQFLDAEIGPDVQSAEMLFSSHGAEIRRLVAQRNRLLFDAWMASVPHHRPGVAGGPGSRPGLSMEEAGKKALEVTEDIQALLP